MAISNFYMQTTGNNMNSGSTNSDSASVTNTGGAWVNATNTFTAVTGTPFSGVNVGDFVSIYPDGTSTGVVFIAQVTAVNGGGAGLTVSSTIKYGTAPTDGAANRSVKVGGAWADFAIFISLGSTTVPLSTQLNIKAGTYSNGTTDRTCSINGTAALIFVVRGYKTTIGDMDTVTHGSFGAATEVPLVTFGNAGNCMTISGTMSGWFNVDFQSSSTSSATLTCSSGSQPVWLHRIRTKNTGASANSRAITLNGQTRVTQGYFEATTSATYCVAISTDSSVVSCVVVGGIAGIGHRVLGRSIFNIIMNCVNDGISVEANAHHQIIGNTIYNVGRDGIRIITAGTLMSALIMNNIMSVCIGNALTNAVGTNLGENILRINNLSHSVAAQESGFGDSAAIGWMSDSSSPFNNPGTDFSLKSTSNAKINGFPGFFENLSTTIGYLDCGAVQRLEVGPISVVSTIHPVVKGVK